LAGFAPAEPPLELGVDEFDDFEIIAEADASDEDLLASHAEQDASGRRDAAAQPPTAGRRPSELDFAAQLDLGDDSDLYLGAQADELSAGQVIDSLQDELTSQHPAAQRARIRATPSDPRAISVGAALEALEADDGGEEVGFDDSEVTDDPDAYRHRAVRPIFDPDPSSSFTLAGIPSDSIDLDPPSSRAQPIEPPRPVRRHAPLSLHEAPVEDDELEHALEALDVDLDDLSIPHASTQLQRDASRPIPGLRAPQPTPAPPPRAPQPTPAPRTAATTPSRAVRPTGLGTPGPSRLAAPRAPSEGVDIDFDDDD
ncbi:MAG TPA: hypothetical protein VHW23_26530, partial [Kofleriaceae bacterium]|nr:hypothetical protein [Kofleriaceae bacterium]